MVHRPADSRLLTNLLNHEKDYSKHLSILLDYSHASLASFSAYASASSPPTSQVIIAVAGVLAGADDALRNYAAAVQRWQEQLKALKTMEDGVGNIMRDREILVTRLIKASKSSQKPARDTSSILGGTSSPSGSSLNVTKPEVQVGQKLSVAQAELQACEAHLAAKEQELSAFRAHTIKSGLEARCKAMVECGWAWGEMGKEGMRALEGLDTANGYGSPSMHPYLQQGLNGNDKAGSDVSSLAPSQSASQIGHGSPPGTHVDPIWRSTSPPPRATSPQPYTLQIPAAHSISEYTVPNSVAHPATIVEEGGSSEDENEHLEGVQFEVHENPLFSKGKAKSTPPSRHHSFSLRHPKPSETNAMGSYSMRSESPTKRRGVLGSLAALFHVGGSRGSDAEHSPNGSPSKTGRWRTRIDQNLAAAQHGDSSEDDVPSHAYTMRASSPSPAKNDREDGELARLKKRTKRGSVQAPGPSRMAPGTDKGYASDTVSESVSKATRARKRTVSKPPAIDGIGGSLRIPGEAGPSSAHRLKRTGAPPVGSPPSLSRNSSMSKQSVISAASAPPRISPTTQATLGRAKSDSVRKRTASLDVQPSKAGPSHKRTASVSTPNGAHVPTVRSSLTTVNGESSLMSIVEGISRMNREAAFKQDPNRMLVVPQAPGPINIAYSESLGELPVIRATPPTPGAPSHPQPQQNGTARPRKKKEGEQRKPEENNYRNSLLLSASMSAPTLPLSGAANHAKAGPSKPLPTSPSAKMPLRSALRNSSRSPSPADASLDNAMNGTIWQTTPVKASAQVQVTANGPVRPVRSPEPAAAPAPVVPALSAEPVPMKRRDSDVSSISSYETSREVFVDDERESGESPPLPPIPLPTPVLQPPDGHAHGFAFQNGDAHHHHQQQQNGSELSHSTTSTAVQAQPEPPRRRKSVRMSLPPTFSATPPAMDDADEGEEGERRRPWAPPPPQRGGWGSRIEEETQRDMWADSDEEEAEYSVAKRMLARLGGGRR
ncbi:hypothetical protein LXA43DRAFT_197720 [Ganoderma leucocontextum]|nr:hypothetical protein LXA43DRAFT_197720 [Ganoderma leucocontextum]